VARLTNCATMTTEVSVAHDRALRTRGANALIGEDVHVKIALEPGVLQKDKRSRRVRNCSCEFIWKVPAAEDELVVVPGKEEDFVLTCWTRC
jgi:hypothetical protein